MSKQVPYRLLPGFLLCKPLEETMPVYGSGNVGVQVSENMSEKDSAGVVIAVGDPWVFREGGKEYKIPCPVKVGDKIIFKNMGYQRYMPFKGEAKGKNLFLMKWHDDVVFTDIMAVIEE